MMNKPLLFLALLCSISISSMAQVDAGRMNEVFIKTDLVPSSTNLRDPWEVTYGDDDSLWITEAASSATAGDNGYKVRKVHPQNGGNRIILDLLTFQDPASSPTTKWRRAFTPGTGGAVSPQGGLMGLAIHPEFQTNPAKKFVYIAYVHTYVGNNQTISGEYIAGPLFRTWVVRFTYSAGMLRSPVALCDTIRGSNDHNSGRMIIAPVGNKNYLFYAVGDQGGGQFGNIDRWNKSQQVNSYDGKILRFNLESDGDAGLNAWIPSDGTPDGTNPFNGATQSAVWSTGIRNNQGFAYARINGKDILYGSSHGPFSDDELNIIEKQKNYGHPLVIGYNDGNYDGARAGQIRYPYSGGTNSTLPLIVSENANVNSINAAIPDSYRDPIYSFYDTIKGTTSIVNSIQYIYNNTSNAYNANGSWASEAPSGMGIYTHSLIPGWKNSLLMTSLKKGRIVRLKLDPTGQTVVPIDGRDTVSYFNSTNKFRDVAVHANGRDLYVSIDRSPTTSGPGATNPIVSACGGCIQKYTFIGYNASATTPFASQIPTSIPIATGKANTCENANYVVINTASGNTNVWVPITDTNSNIIAEIYANGNSLDTVRTTIFKNAGAVREDGAKRLYLDRNITIKPDVQPSTPVRIRLYITDAEFQAIKNATNSNSQPSGINTITNLGIFKTASNTCTSTIGTTMAGTAVTVTARTTHGNGHVLQANSLASFSSFFFANAANSTLPQELITFTGALNTTGVKLSWQSAHEVNTSNYVIERSIDGSSFTDIGTVAASGNTTGQTNYSFDDNNARAQQTLVLYYRLKMVDADGEYKYSQIVLVSLADISSRIVVSPNPTPDETKVVAKAITDGEGKWTLTDNTGRVIMHSKVFMKKGSNLFNISIRHLAAGIYYLNVTGGGIDEKVKVQKL